MSNNNFRKKAVLKKISVVKYSYKAKNCTKKFGGRTCVYKFLQWLALDFPYKICNISLDFITDKCIESFKKLF